MREDIKRLRDMGSYRGRRHAQVQAGQAQFLLAALTTRVLGTAGERPGHAEPDQHCAPAQPHGAQELRLRTAVQRRTGWPCTIVENNRNIRAGRFGSCARSRRVPRLNPKIGAAKRHRVARPRCTLPIYQPHRSPPVNTPPRPVANNVDISPDRISRRNPWLYVSHSCHRCALSVVCERVRGLTGAASGLYYLSELVEEHTVFSKKLLTTLIQGIIVVHILLLLFDGFPILLTLFSAASHAVYLANVSNSFPSGSYPTSLPCCACLRADMTTVRLSDPVFLLSCGIRPSKLPRAPINHY